MTITFKFVSGNEGTGPLGVVSIIDPDTNQPEYPNLMIGTNCINPASLNVLSNWHFRVENVPQSDIYPKQLDGPSATYGTWYNPKANSQRSDNKCNASQNWPMHVVQSSGPNGYIWDIYVAPYLGSSYISGIEPMLPIPDTTYTLQLYQGTSLYDTVTSEPILPLFPIFGEARSGKSNADFYPALFGWTYKDPDHPDGPTAHVAVDIIPLGLFASGDPGADWDLTADAEYKKVFAVVSGTVLIDDVSTPQYPNLRDVTIYTVGTSNYPNMQFTYSHIEVDPSITHNTTISAGDLIGTILNHTDDPRSGKTHLHFEAGTRSANIRAVDARQFIYPGLTPNP